MSEKEPAGESTKGSGEGGGPDVLVIGAGPAGCSASLLLAEKGQRVWIVEKLSQVGGLSRTIERNGARYDIGPHRFFTKAQRVQDMWRRVGGDDLHEVDRLTRILFQGNLLNYPLEPLNALKGLGVLRSMKAMGSYGQSRAERMLKPRNPESFEDWVVDHFGRVLYDCFFKTYTEKVWGISCDKVASTWASQRIKGLDLPKAILNALTSGRTSTVKTLVNKFWYPSHGSGGIYENMCATVTGAGGKVVRNTEVTGVFHDGKKRITGIETRLSDGQVERIEADHYVVTMPLTDLVLRLKPEPPEEVLQAARALKYRTHLSVNLLVKGNPFPDNWIYVHSPDLKVGRVANYRNFSNHMSDENNHSPLTFEYFTFDGDEIERLPDSELIKLALSEGKSAGLLPTDSPKDAFVVRSRKAYCVIERGYEEHCDTIQRFLERFGNIHPAGRAGMFKYNNQDHSIMTGILAAENIMGGSHDVWNVNIDAEYHESGTAPDLCEEDREKMELK